MRFGPVTLHGGFFILLGLMLFFDGDGLFFCLCIAALVHESGHLLVLWLAGGRVESLHCSIFGLFIQTAAFPALSYGRECVATLAGPLFSLAGCFLCPALAPWLDWTESTQYALMGTFFVQGAFNLLPARSLDGGRALASFVTGLRGEQAADRVLRVTTLSTMLVIALAAVWMFWRSGFDFSLLALFGYGLVSMLTNFSGGTHERKNRTPAAAGQ